MKNSEYFAYKGYLVRYNRTTESYMINKEGYFIGWSRSPDEVKSIIDSLAECQTFGLT